MSKVTEIPRLTMQQQVDTCQALLEMDDCQNEGLVKGFGTVDRNKCRAFLKRAKLRGFVPGEGRFAIGQGLLKLAGGEFIEDPQTPPTGPTRNAGRNKKSVERSAAE